MVPGWIAATGGGMKGPFGDGEKLMECCILETQPGRSFRSFNSFDKQISLI